MIVHITKYRDRVYTTSYVYEWKGYLHIRIIREKDPVRKS